MLKFIKYEIYKTFAKDLFLNFEDMELAKNNIPF